MSRVISKAKERVSIKTQVLATVMSIVSAVALPQIFHVMGIVSGAGTALGEFFLPMHLPVMLVGLLAGPYAGAIAGVMSPLVSFALTGMPASAMLPFMMIELCIYGLVSGLLKDIKIPTVAKVLITQVSGRAIRAIAILVAIYGLDSTRIPVSVIWTSIAVGIFGIVLQLVFLPLIVYRVEGAKSNE